MLERLTISFIDIYRRYVRTMLPASCRFYPSCSEYARQAIVSYGVVRGILKASRRILRCHPFSQKSGYDPLI